MPLLIVKSEYHFVVKNLITMGNLQFLQLKKQFFKIVYTGYIWFGTYRKEIIVEGRVACIAPREQTKNTTRDLRGSA